MTSGPVHHPYSARGKGGGTGINYARRPNTPRTRPRSTQPGCRRGNTGGAHFALVARWEAAGLFPSEAAAEAERIGTADAQAALYQFKKRYKE